MEKLKKKKKRKKEKRRRILPSKFGPIACDFFLFFLDFEVGDAGAWSAIPLRSSTHQCGAGQNTEDNSI